MLRRGAAADALAFVAEAVASADHQVVNAFTLECADGEPPGPRLPTLKLDALRMSATELVQTSNKRLGDAGAYLACGFVARHGARLHVVKLADCDLGDAGAEAVAGLVGGIAGPCVKELNLSSNRIGDRGARAIADALRTADVLERLILDRNRIGRSGAEALAKRVLRSEVRDLVLGSHLGGNPAIGDAGAEALAAALDDRMQRLQANREGRLSYLSLECCGIGDQGAMAIAANLPGSAIVTLCLARGAITDGVAAVLLGSLPVTARAMDLAGNQLTDSAAIVAASTLSLRPQLAISVAQNQLSSAMQQLLQEEHGTRMRT